MIATVMPKHLNSGLATGPLKKRQKMAHDSPRTALESAIFANGDGRRLTASTTKIPASLKQIRQDESRVAVAKADGSGDVDLPNVGKPAVVEISSDSSSSEDSDEDEEDEEDVTADEPAMNGDQAKQNGHVERTEINGRKERSEESEVEADEEGAVDDAEQEEPSFGELLQAGEPDPIDVEASFADESAGLVQHSSRALSVPSANSLGTVLTQALRTNDAELLESCFRVHDLDSVRTTVERLPSNLVATLLHKLAEKMQSRPGRAGRLMVWVQWALVSHGGYLAGQPDLMIRLKSLHRVISERANALSPLLQLKGKLDMLNAQLELRKSMQRAAAADNDENDDAMIYVEGEDESSDEEDEEMAGDIDDDILSSKKLQGKGDLGDDGDEDEEMPLINGIAHVEDASDESEMEEENLIGDDAEESSDEEEASDDEEIEEESGEEEEDDVSDSEDELNPAKRSAAATAGFARR